MKKIVLASIIALLVQTCAAKDFEIWSAVSSTQKIIDTCDLNISFEYDFLSQRNKNLDLERVIFHTELLQKVSHNHSVAFEFQNRFTKQSPSVWRKEYRPGALLYYKIAGVNTRFRLFYRAVDQERGRSGASCLIDVPIVKHKGFLAYVSEEMYYNVFNTKQPDLNYLTAGLLSTFTNILSLNTFYALVFYKTPTLPSNIYHALGFTLNVYF
jgi:hypothetical protein